jgi:hypothetical protein
VPRSQRLLAEKEREVATWERVGDHVVKSPT